MTVISGFYLDCDVFSYVKKFNENFGNDYLKRLHLDLPPILDTMIS